LPVKVVAKTRTLWTLPQTSSTSMAHKPFEDLFTGSLELQPHSIVLPQDVVFFDGGTDVNPQLYGEEPHVTTSKPDGARDAREINAFMKAQKVGASCFGVCRGAQFLTAMSGGKLIQHVTGHNHGGHLIVTYDGKTMWSESSHHQVMWPYNIPHVMIAWATNRAQEPFVVSDEYGKEVDDGEFPEIIYCKSTRCLCIQGHAEWSEPDGSFYKFTRELVQEFLIQER
jgi:GMP synthase-like glutamine amidotransferase